MQSMSRKEFVRRAALLGVSAPTIAAILGSGEMETALAQRTLRECHPTDENRPVCPRGARPETATFIDPTAIIEKPENITLDERIYIAPFARIIAGGRDAPIEIGAESNVQDSVVILAEGGSGDDDGVIVGREVIMAHGCAVQGPARIGAPEDLNEEQSVFLSFGAFVDGATVEPNSGLSILSRVGPGVRLPSGFIVLPGKNVTTQRQAEKPKLGKVREITPDDVAFNRAVIEVNTSFAREYTRLFYDNPSNVRGINVDPGNTRFNHDRDLPSFAGQPVRDPNYRNRLIGDIDFAQSRNQVSRAQGNQISLRADEGEPFEVGRIARMEDNTIFHALEESELVIGSGVHYGARAIVHGGGRRPAAGGGDEEPTTVRDNVTLRSLSVVFRSLIGDGATVGFKSGVISSEIKPGRVVPDRTIILNNATFGRVEW